MLLGAFDETEHVAHAEDALREPVWMELLQRVELLARADVLDWHAGDLAQRQRRAAASVTVELGQNHAGQRHVLIEAFGDADGFLTGHGVCDEQDLVRLDFAFHRLELAHELFVDLQPPRRVDDDKAQAGLLGVFDGGLGELGRLLARVVKDRHVDLLAERLQLGDRGWSIRVGRHKQRRVAHLADLHGEFAGGGRLARPLQTNKHDDGGRFARHRQARWRRAQQLDQLVVDELDDRLRRGQAVQDVLADRFLFDRGDELADHFE